MSTTLGSDSYRLPAEHEDLRALIRQIAEERIRPRAAAIDAEGEYPHDVRRLLAGNDILALPFDPQYGGTGTGTLMLQVAVEEIARACASSALILMVQELGTLPIALFGSDEMKERFLPRCATGEWSPAFCLSEAEAGSNAAAMRTRAHRDGDEWVLNGAKNWITNAGIADFYVVFAVTDREHARVTAFVVEAETPGFSVGGYEHKLGIRGSPTGSPVFEDVRLPTENVIGEVDRGMRVALATLERTRLGAAAQAVGIAQGATDYANGYAAGADRLRQAHQRAPGPAVQARGHGDGHRRVARAALPGVRHGRPPRAPARPGQVDVDGQALRLRQRHAGDGRGGPGARRLRVRDRLPG